MRRTFIATGTKEDYLIYNVTTMLVENVHEIVREDIGVHFIHECNESRRHGYAPNFMWAREFACGTGGVVPDLSTG